MIDDEKKKPTKPKPKFEDGPLWSRVAALIVTGSLAEVQNHYADESEKLRLVTAIAIYVVWMGAITYQFAVDAKRRGPIQKPPRPGRSKPKPWFKWPGPK